MQNYAEIHNPQESLLQINNEDLICYSRNWNDCELLNTEYVVKELPANYGKSVQFILSNANADFIKSIQVINKEGNQIEVDKINWPNQLKQISKLSNFNLKLLDSYLEHSYLRIAELNDGTIKLYINQEGLGGMKPSSLLKLKNSTDKVNEDDKDNKNNNILPQEKIIVVDSFDDKDEEHQGKQTGYFNQVTESKNISSISAIKEKVKRYLEEDPQLLEKALEEVEKTRTLQSEGIQRDIKAINSIKAIPSMFQIISKSTGMKWVAIGRATEEKWIACSVYDELAFGMEPGGELPIETTICDDVRKYHKLIVIDDVGKDLIYCNHAGPKLYKYQSYISTPVIRKNGCFFGTLCAIDPEPAKLNNPETIGIFQLFADLISFHLQSFEDLEDHKKANIAKTNLVSHVSHEIRTPLSGILGFLELALRAKECHPTIREYLNYAYNSTLSLKTVADDILDITKMESEVFKLETIPFSPVFVAREVLAGFQVAAEKKGVALKIEESQRVPEALIGDPLRFKQILLNLVGNSLKFTSYGSVKIELDGIADKEPSLFRLKGTVKDTGMGMDVQTSEKLFKPFVQAEDSTARKFGGTGLGLCITKQLCEKMGGNIKVLSELGLGSTFEFILYFTLPDTKVVIQKDNSLLQETSKLPPLNILVAEDNLMNQKLLKIILEKEKCKITIASNGEEAVTAVMEKKFDIVLMDGEMPGMDGIEATQMIRAQFSSMDLPIIGLTGHAMSTHKELFLNVGMNGYLAKPINKQTLFNEILRCVRPVQSQQPFKKFKSDREVSK